MNRLGYYTLVSVTLLWMTAALRVPGQAAAGEALILGIDRFMSEARSLTNFIGNGIAAIVVARWENELDSERLTQELTGAHSTPAPPPGEGSRQFADL